MRPQLVEIRATVTPFAQARIGMAFDLARGAFIDERDALRIVGPAIADHVREIELVGYAAVPAEAGADFVIGGGGAIEIHQADSCATSARL